MSKLRKRKELPKSLERLNVASQIEDKTPAHCGCCAKCLVALACGVLCIVSVAAVSYYRAPFIALPINDLSTPLPLSGPLKSNDRLTKGYKVGGLSCPESIVEDDSGYLYTSLANGRIVKLGPSYDGRIGAGKVANISIGMMHATTPRADLAMNHGRPAGLRLVKDELYFADANFGILSVNIKTKLLSHLLTTDAVDPPLKFPNDLCLSDDNEFIYFSDSSSKYSLTNMLYIDLEGICDGRVLQYGRKDKQVKTVLSGLCFPNGIQLSNDGVVMFVAETLRFRVRIVDMATWATVRVVSFPMMPDNIRPTGKGTYWVAGSLVSDPVSLFMEKSPMFRQMLSGLFSHQTLMRALDFKHNILVEMGRDGEIIQSLHDPRGALSLGLSQATTLRDGRLALAQHTASYLSILEAKDVAVGSQDST